MSDVHAQSTFSLPLEYGNNRIVLMVRDPHWLYAYWEISPEKRNAFIQEFGQDLWEKSYPVLRITNVSKNESFFIRINDYTNNWYIYVEDANSLFVAEIGRSIAQQFFINLASSNYIYTPSETVSNNTSAYFVDYRTMKGGYLDLESKTITRYQETILNTNFTIGVSSPELFGINLHESMFGVSSAELYGINIPQHLGISSESFIR